MADSMKSNGKGSPPSHAIGRFVAQWVLPVLAFAVVLHGSVMQIRTLCSMLAFDSPFDDSAMSYWKLPGPGSLTPDQRLILNGDRTRGTAVEKQKAIWEKWPTNVVYLHNYITHLVESVPHHGADDTTNTDGRARLAQEIERIQPLDPGNARLDYLLAGNLLAQAIEGRNSETNADGTVTNRWSMKVLDRAKLDQAMAHMKTGLGKPKFRRYTGEMTSQRLVIMGEPATLLEQITQISMLAGVLLPDMAMCRQLARASMVYAGLLIDEGRTKEAGEFLAAFRKFVPQVNNDAYTLIDIMVVGAVAVIAAEQVPAAYTRLGDEVAEKQAGIETAALAQPVKDWKRKVKESRDGPKADSLIRRHGGIMAGLLLPSLAEYPTAAELAPSRHLEYVVAERVGLSVLSVCLVVLMVFCVLMAPFYHRVIKTPLRSACLLPRGRDWGRLLVYGVLLPVLCYYGVTIWAPWSDRSMTIITELPQFIAQLIALLLVIVAVTVTITGQWVRRGCHNLSLPAPPLVPVLWCAWMWILVGVSVVLAVLPESWWTAEKMSWPVWMLAVAGRTVILSGLVYLVCGIVRREWFRRTYAAYYGSLARTLIPAIALVVIVLNVVSQPYLSREERHLIAIDTVMRIDPGGGFTAIESRLVQRLKAEMQEAAARFPELRARSGN